MHQFTPGALAHISACVLLSFSVQSFAADAPSLLSGLDVLRGEFPLSLRFRGERYDNGGGRHAPPLAETQATMATESDGVLEKMVHDIGRYDSSGQQATAAALPAKILVEHMLFGSASFDFAEDFSGKWPFSRCHFAYFVGSKASENPLPTATAIKVADATKFREGDAVIMLRAPETTDRAVLGRNET